MMAYQRRASASQLNLLKSCKRRWYFQYIEKRKQPPSVAMFKGTLIHSIIEHFYIDMDIRRSGISIDNYEEKFTEHINKIFDVQLKIDREYFGKPLPSLCEDIKTLCENDLEYALELADVRKMVRNFINQFLLEFDQFVTKYNKDDPQSAISKAFHSMKPKFNELVFDFPDVQGYADMVGDKGGPNNEGLYILDIKTSKMYKTGLDPQNYLQLCLYAYLYWRQTNIMPTWGVILYVRYNRECVYKIPENCIEEMEELLAWYKETTATENKEDYSPNYEYTFCTCDSAINEKRRGKDWCPFQEQCNLDTQEPCM